MLTYRYIFLILKACLNMLLRIFICNLVFSLTATLIRGTFFPHACAQTPRHSALVFVLFQLLSPCGGGSNWFISPQKAQARLWSVLSRKQMQSINLRGTSAEGKDQGRRGAVLGLAGLVGWEGWHHDMALAPQSVLWVYLFTAPPPTPPPHQQLSRKTVASRFFPNTETLLLDIQRSSSFFFFSQLLKSLC